MRLDVDHAGDLLSVILVRFANDSREKWTWQQALDVLYRFWVI